MPDPHEIWSAAQLAPGEGIEDGVARIEALLALPAPAMDSELTRAQFALQALVSAGLVSQFKVDQALALFPAPAGEPEMPEPAGYTHHEDIFGNELGPPTPIFHEAQLRAYGDARAEHARRVAMEDAAKICEGIADGESFVANTQGERAADQCVIVIRAAAPPQGEQT